MIGYPDSFTIAIIMLVLHAIHSYVEQTTRQKWNAKREQELIEQYNEFLKGKKNVL